MLHAKATSKTENTLPGIQTQLKVLLMLGKLQNKQPPVTPKTKTLQKGDCAGRQLPRQRNGPSTT